MDKNNNELLMEEQLKLEKESLRDAKTRADNLFFSLTDKSKGSLTNEAVVLIKKAIPPVEEKLKEYINNKAIRGKASQIREPILMFKDNEQSLAYLVLSAIMDSVLQPSGGKYPPFHCALPRVAREIVNRIRTEYKIKLVEEDHASTLSLNKIDEYFKRMPKSKLLQRKLLLASKIMELGEYDNIEGVQLGVNLVDAVIKSGVDLVTVITKRERQNKKRTFVKLTDSVINIILNMKETSPFFMINYPPLIVKPKPWTEFYGSGGYYSDFIEIPLVKLYSDRYNRGLIANYFETHPRKTKRFFKVLNKIQETEWKINTKLLDVIETIYDLQLPNFNNEFELLGGLPADNLKPDYEVFSEIPDSEDKEVMRKFLFERENYRENLLVTRSKLLTVKLALSIANKFKKYNKFYYSYQVDFRGRLYPIQQHLNPQSAKHLKPLIQFAKGKPLDTDSAYRWFMIHGANVYGYDKLTYDERVNKMEELHEEILRCARNPYKHTEWENADEPFAYLSWCFEYYDYITDPVAFRSHIPIALDASCSGIQIYSGLLLDKKGARAVNVAQDYEIIEVPDDYVLKQGEEWYED